MGHSMSPLSFSERFRTPRSVHTEANRLTVLCERSEMLHHGKTAWQAWALRKSVECVPYRGHQVDAQSIVHTVRLSLLPRLQGDGRGSCILKEL